MRGEWVLATAFLLISGCVGPPASTKADPAPSVVLTGALQPAIPRDTIHVNATYDRVSFAIILGTTVAPLPQGVYRETVTAPGNRVFEQTVTPLDPVGFRIFFAMLEQPDGDWTLDHVAGGPGIAGAEGVGYHVYDVDMPSGHVLASTGEHQHGD